MDFDVALLYLEMPLEGFNQVLVLPVVEFPYYI